MAGQKLPALLIVGAGHHDGTQLVDHGDIVFGSADIWLGKKGRRLFALKLRGAVGAHFFGTGKALGQWQVGITRNAEAEIERHRAKADHKDHNDRKNAAGAFRAGCRGTGSRLVGSENPAGDLGAGALGLVLAENAALEIAGDLGQLVTVNGDIGAALAAPPQAAPERQSQKDGRDRRKDQADGPKEHGASGKLSPT